MVIWKHIGSQMGHQGATGLGEGFKGCCHIHISVHVHVTSSLSHSLVLPRVHMLPGIRLKELAVAVNSSDDSYMPKIMTVSVGNSPLHMREVKSHTIPRSASPFI